MNQRLALIAGAAIGAGLMYVLDPISGKRPAFTHPRQAYPFSKTNQYHGRANRSRSAEPV
jgi:hypothetical protein